MEQLNLSYIYGRESVIVVLDGKPHVVHKGESYNTVVDGIRNRDLGIVRDAVLAHFRIKRTLEKFGNVRVEHGHVYLDDREVHGYLVDRILHARNNAELVKPLAAFLENVYANPDFRAREDLFKWVEATKLPITPDGHIVAMRIVSHDFKDLRTKTMDNSPGSVVTQPREQCDDNPDVTCSRGLHFAEASYLPKYSSDAAAKVVVVKINPADVVAFPRDYGWSKGRCCRFEVLHEVPRDEAAQYFANAGFLYAPPPRDEPVFDSDPDATRDWDVIDEVTYPHLFKLLVDRGGDVVASFSVPSQENYSLDAFENDLCNLSEAARNMIAIGADDEQEALMESFSMYDFSNFLSDFDENTDWPTTSVETLPEDLSADDLDPYIDGQPETLDATASFDLLVEEFTPPADLDENLNPLVFTDFEPKVGIQTALTHEEAPVAEPVKAKKPAKKVAKKPAKKVAKKPVKKVAKKQPKKAAKRPTKKSTKKTPASRVARRR